MGMDTPLNASANSAGELFSSTIFEIPEFQREYSWSARGEVTDFWTDLQNGLGNEVYFLGLVILTAADERKQVVDGQQRIITLSLLAAALYHEALAKDREALADRISATFLRSINYETDDEGVAQKTSRMLEVLGDRALVPYVRRTFFEDLALQRNRTKTPPGFRDRNDNNGDFYVWADLLRGLQVAVKERILFANVVFVSEEKKDDWVRDSRPHPILSAEVKALVNSSFTIVDLATLVRLVREAS